MSRHAGQECGLVGDDADGPAVEPREADDHVAGEVLVHLEELAIVHHAMNHILDVVGQIGFGGNDGVEGGVHAVGRVCGGAARRIFAIVLRQVADQLANHAQAFGIVGRDEVAYAAHRIVGHGAAEFFLGDVFVGDGADHVGAGDEHVAGMFHHEDEIGDGGGIDGATGAGAHDGGDLRHDAACQGVAQEDIGVPGERDDAFLDAGAAGIVEADDGGSRFQGEVHDLADLERVSFRERAAEHGEVLREDIDEAAVDAAVAGDETVAGDDLVVHAEVAAAVLHQLVQFFEGALVEQQFDALARAELSFFMLARAAFRPAAVFRGGATAAQFFHSIHRDYCKGNGNVTAPVRCGHRGGCSSGGLATGWCCRRNRRTTR